MQDGRSAYSPVGKEQRLLEARSRKGGTDRQGDTGQLLVEGAVFRAKSEWNQSGAQRRHADAKLFRDTIAETGGSQFGKR